MSRRTRCKRGVIRSPKAQAEDKDFTALIREMKDEDVHQLVENSPKLFDLEWFPKWRFDKFEAEAYLFSLFEEPEDEEEASARSSLEDDLQKSLSQALEHLATPELKRRLQRNLLRFANKSYRKGYNKEVAKLALAAAISLEREEDARNPFLRRMLVETMADAVTDIMNDYGGGLIRYGLPGENL